jgi:hypothetical protein
LTTLLKARRPEHFKDRAVIEHDVSDRLADRLEAARLRMIERLQTTVIEGTAAEVVGESMGSSAESAGDPHKP